MANISTTCGHSGTPLKLADGSSLCLGCARERSARPQQQLPPAPEIELTWAQAWRLLNTETGRTETAPFESNGSLYAQPHHARKDGAAPRPLGRLAAEPGDPHDPRPQKPRQRKFRNYGW